MLAWSMSYEILKACIFATIFTTSEMAQLYACGAYVYTFSSVHGDFKRRLGPFSCKSCQSVAAILSVSHWRSDANIHLLASWDRKLSLNVVLHLKGCTGLQVETDTDLAHRLARELFVGAQRLEECVMNWGGS